MGSEDGHMTGLETIFEHLPFGKHLTLHETLRPFLTV